MAIKIATEYTEANPPDANYAGGSFKNVTTPGGTDGTPFEKAWPNDLQGFFQKLIKDGNITVNNLPDTMLVSDYFSGLANLFNRAIPYEDTGIANTYFLNPTLPRQPLLGYYNGLIAQFKISNTNTGASTVNIDSIGVVPIINGDGSPLAADQLPANAYVTIRYRTSAASFEIVSVSEVGGLDNIYNRIIAYNDAGTVNDYDLIAAKGAGYNAYEDDIIVLFKATTTNTGPCVMSLDGLAEAPLTQSDGTALAGGEIAINDYIIARYNLSIPRFELVFTKYGGVNQGGGIEIFKSVSGANDFRYRTLVDGVNTTVVQNTNTIQVNASGGSGEANDGANVGGGVGIYKDKTGVDINLKSLIDSATIDVNAVGANEIEFNYIGTAGGKVVQSIFNSSGTYFTSNNVLPFDGTIPQNTEGDEITTVVITPTNAANKLQIRAILHGESNNTGAIGAALFKDATVGAFKAGWSSDTNDHMQNVVIETEIVAGGTSAITFRLRGGSSANTFAHCGRVSAGQIGGGTLKSILVVTELLP